MKKIGIVRETKNKWERRVPFIPEDVRTLLSGLPIEVKIQPSPLRIFADSEYEQAGAAVDDDLHDCDLIFAIKEIKTGDLIAEKVYTYFSHTIKGQSYNMDMLHRLIDLRCTLIDYERMVNAGGQRLIYFSVHAGLAGIVESLWAFGQQQVKKGIKNPFEKIGQTYTYKGLEDIKTIFREVAADIERDGLPDVLRPLVIGITGYGNVAKGVQELLDILPVQDITPGKIHELGAGENVIYKIVFKENDMVRPVDNKSPFDLQDYYDYPEKYTSVFDRYLPHLNILVNASFWDTKYPRHVPNSSLQILFRDHDHPRLQLIGDISCDIEGGIQCTIRATDPGDPVFTYHPRTDSYTDGIAPDGIVIMSVDNLPSELPKDASTYFSGVLKTLLPDMVKADYTVAFDNLDLPDSIKNAIIVYNGQLTPNYNYLKKYL